MTLIITFDADNTIWDTDSVFRNSQLAMLTELAKTKLFNDPESKLDILRNIDFELGRQIGRFEYDFRLLAIAILDYYSTTHSIQSSIHHALTRSQIREKYFSVIEHACSEFEKNMRKIPRLYPDSQKVFNSLLEQKIKGTTIITLLFSEGDPARLERILKAYQIREKAWFDQIIIDEKNYQSYSRVKKIGKTLLQKKYGHQIGDPIYIMVGDNLQRDILLANQAGFITVYKPSRYRGREVPNNLDDMPSFNISRLGELLIKIEAIKLRQNESAHHIVTT